MGGWDAGHDEGLLQFVWNVITGWQPVVVGFELGCYHAKTQVLSAAQAVQIQIADLYEIKCFNDIFSSRHWDPLQIQCWFLTCFDRRWLSRPSWTEPLSQKRKDVMEYFKKESPIVSNRSRLMATTQEINLYMILKRVLTIKSDTYLFLSKIYPKW